MEFPAIFIGGPPHSGKSVFMYNLKWKIAQQAPRPAYYLLRAAPDGEGDWSSEATPELVEALRIKQAFTMRFARRIAADVANRQLPFLVDAGGRITSEQRLIAKQCTHAILLSNDTDRLAEWREFAYTCGLEVLAELHSVLDARDRIVDDGTVLRAVIGGLERHAEKDGPVLEALAGRLRGVLTLSHAEAFAYHRDRAPTAHVVDLQTVPPTGDGRWEPVMLPALVLQVASAGAVSLYGVAPSWVYAAVAARLAPGACHLFDARLGWVQPPVLHVGGTEPAGVLGYERQENDAYLRLNVHLRQPHVTVEEVAATQVPAVSTDRGIVIGGKLSNWTYVALVYAYADAPWLAVYYPQQESAVVIASTDDVRPIGTVVPVP